MTAPRRPRRSRFTGLTPNEYSFLRDQPPGEPEKKWEVWALNADCTPFREDRLSVADLWITHGDDVLAEWVAEAPGTRPSLWWRFSAPRATDNIPERWHADTPPPIARRRLGGIGTPCHECLAHALHYALGIPAYWLSRQMADFYNGRTTGGRVVPAHYREGYFPWPPVDPDDPPIFESQAEYLERQGLLLPGEAERLTAQDFEFTPVAALDD